MSLETLRHLFDSASVTRGSFLKFVGALALSPLIGKGFHCASPDQQPRRRGSAQAIAKLKAKQEQAYIALGRQLELGTDPLEVFRRYTTGKIPRTKLTTREFEQQLGVKLDSAQLSGLDSTINQYLKSYYDVELPTPYEDPNFYPTLLSLADRIEVAAKELDQGLGRPILVGTLPRGDVDARSVLLSTDEDPVIVVNFGLFQLAYHVSILAATTLPRGAITGEIPWFAVDLALPRFLDANPGIIRHFSETLYGYIVRGDPRWVPRLRLDDPVNRASAIEVLQRIELFCIAHEYGHILKGHVAEQREINARGAKDPDWDRGTEHNADAYGLILSTSCLGNITHAFFGASYFLACHDVLQRGIAVLRTGSADKSHTDAGHPSPTERRDFLVGVARQLLSDSNMKAKIDSVTHIPDLIGILWKRTEPIWIEMHRKGIRPAPIW
jgi:hypothetical protein